MIEAQIICSNPCNIGDLGIVGLKRGDERWVSVAAAERSRDLAKEQGKGNVRVYRKARRMESAPRRPPPPFVAASRPQVHDRAGPEVVEKRVEIERVVEVDTDELARKMKDELLGDIKSVIAQEVGKALAAQEPPAPQAAVPAPEPGLDATQLENVLEGVLRRVGVSGGGSGGGGKQGSTKGPEDPLFIPTDIVDKDARGKITVKSKESEGTDDLDEAGAALREMKRRSRAGKTKGNEEQ